MQFYSIFDLLGGTNNLIKEAELEKSEVIILEADGKVDETNGYGFLIQKRLNEFNINSVKLYLPEIVEQLETLPYKPMIISGGMTEVTADIEWINKSKEFIQAVIKENRKSKSNKRPLFGICFGAQLIAEGFKKGSVTYLDDPEIGITKVIVSKKHPLFQSFPKEYLGYTFHYNQILPKMEFNILSLNEHMGHKFIQAFEIPEASCFGVQFHPEFGYQEFLILMQTYHDLIIELGLDYNEIIESIREIDSNEKLFYNFIKFQQ